LNEKIAATEKDFDVFPVIELLTKGCSKTQKNG
jgi:hypothetical protein